jgi:MSHA biogenesis protein MshJ
MDKLNWKKLAAWLDARQVRERAVLLAGVLGLLVYAWFTMFHEVMVLRQADLRTGIIVLEAQVLEQRNRQAEIEGTFTQDPNSFALTRQRELRAAMATADGRLNALYGELISPQQMSQVLTTILQRETSLKLVSLENQLSEALVTAELLASQIQNGGIADVQVFKHGLRMVFQGGFLETVGFLRSLEQLDSNFFWETLDFTVAAGPGGTVSLEIYTLSTQRGWIGV